MKLIRKIELECVDGEHFKRWIGEAYDEGTVITRWGRADLDNESLQSKMFPGVGIAFLEKKEKEKLKKGYEVVD